MRIKLDLSDFLEDERKLAVLNVNEQESRTVRDVLGKIIKLFKLKPWYQDADVIHSKKLNIGLFEDEFFIHPDETSSVLQGIGILKLKTLPSLQETEGKKAKKQRKNKSEVDLIQNDDIEEIRKNKKSGCKDVISSHWREGKKERKRKVEYITSNSEEDLDDVRNARKRRKLYSESETEIDESELRKNKNIGEESMQSKVRRRKTTSQPLDLDCDYVTKVIKWKKKTKVIEECDSDGDDLQELYNKNKGMKSQLLVPEFEESTRGRRPKRDSILDYTLGLRKPKKKVDEVQNIIAKQEISEQYLEEEKSQVKVVSTSTVVDLLSDDSTDSRKVVDTNLSKKQTYEQDDGPHMVDSVTDPPACLEPVRVEKKKRSRKHNKRKRTQDLYLLQNAIHGNVVEDQSGLCGEAIFPLNYSKVKTTKSVGKQNSHIIFNSDDETISSLQKDDGRSLSNAYRTHVQDANIPEQNKKGCLMHTQRVKDPDIVEVEGEALLAGSLPILSPSRLKMKKKIYKDRHTKTDVENADGDIHEGEIYRSTIPVMKKKPPVVVQDDGSLQMLDSVGTSSLEKMADVLDSQQKISDGIDELASLRRICENSTLTVVKADQRRRPQIKIQERERKLSGKSLNLGPPSPSSHIPLDITSESIHSLHSLMIIEDRTMPLVIPRSRRLLRDANEKTIDESSMNFSDVENNSIHRSKNPAGGNNSPPPLTSLKENEEVTLDIVETENLDEISEVLPEETHELPHVDLQNKSYSDKESVVEGIFFSASNVREPDSEEVEVEEEDNMVNDDEIVSEAEIVSVSSEVEVRQVEDKAEIKDDSTKGVQDSLKMRMQIIEQSKLIDDNNVSKYPILNSLPKVGDFIAVKLPSLDEGYRPVYSGYICVQVLAVNGWKIRFRFIEDIETAMKEVKDFEEVDLTEDEDLEEIDWRDIDVPRLLCP